MEGSSLWIEVEVSQLTACLEYIEYRVADNIRNLQAKAGQYFREIVDAPTGKTGSLKPANVEGVYYIDKDDRASVGYYDDNLFHKERSIGVTKITSSAGQRLVPEDSVPDEENITRDTRVPGM